MTEGRDEDEWRKRITSALRNSPSFLLIDNVRGRLESSQLASLLTSNEWSDRLLGESRMLSFSVRCAFVVTANNPAFSTEMMRRSARIRLDPQVDKAWLREGFKISDLRSWAINNRAELVWSALVLIRAWLTERKPPFQGKKLGSYEKWSEVLGGILDVAGIEGFLSNINDFYEEADTDGEVWRSFVHDWWYRFGSKEVSVGELWRISEWIEMFDIGHGTERSQKVTFGKLLAAARDRQVGDFRILRAGTRHRATLWHLKWTGDGEPPATAPQEREREREYAYGN